MDAVVASHPSALAHDTGIGHPERPDRVTAVINGVNKSGLEIIDITSPEIDRSTLELVHEPGYIEMIESLCARGGALLDPDTVISEHSWEAGLTAAGGVLATIEELETREDTPGFVVSRPPGHHALPDRAMGFCIFNNLAVSASFLRTRGQRVAILDWDVHHGNGTQTVFLDDPGVLYVSLHQSPFYPYEGEVGDIDRGDAVGTTVNIPLPYGTGGDVYRRAWGELVLPVVEQFGPDWVLISAGYDAHVDDPLGGLRLKAGDYGWMSAALSGVHSPGRIVAVLEGGYDLTALEDSVAKTLRGLAGVAFEDDEPAVSPDGSFAALDVAAEAVSRHWAG